MADDESLELCDPRSRQIAEMKTAVLEQLDKMFDDPSVTVEIRRGVRKLPPNADSYQAYEIDGARMTVVVSVGGGVASPRHVNYLPEQKA